MPRTKDWTKKGAIYDAAVKLVVERGFYGLKMAHVAKAAGMATGTLYIYFSNKEELINELFLKTKKEIAKVLTNPAHNAEGFQQSFRNRWFAYFRFCKGYPEKMLFVEQFLHSGFLSESIIAEAETLFQPLDDFLHYGQQEQRIRKLNVEVLKAQLMGPIHEIVKISLKRPDIYTENLLEQCFEMAWNSMRV